MLASDLAEIYGYTTRAFNQQVRRNIERFPKDFMFELTIEEAESISRSQNVTLNDKKVERGSNIKYAPMVFTESLTKVIQSFSLPEKGIEYVIYSGKTFEADSAYADIYSKAKRKIFIVDVSTSMAIMKCLNIFKEN